MAKKGMSRIDRTHTKPRNTEPPVPEIQGKARSGKEHAKPIVASTQGHKKVYHSTPHKTEKPISPADKAIDAVLACDNLENDISKADLEDM